MTSCLEFREHFHAGTNDAALLEHIRRCDGCLDYAAHIDPDVMFRAIGTEGLVPPGGVDAFVEDVMHAVQLRTKEHSFRARPALQWPRKLAVAALITVGITGATLSWRVAHESASPAPATMAALRHHFVPPAPTKPALETYSSPGATIVEVPSGTAAETRVVMVIDDNLPADL